jgi:hypothetical protein
MYNTGNKKKVSLNCTLPISLCYSTHKVFKSHVKSSQADFLYSSSTKNFLWLSPSENWLLPEPKKFCHLYSPGTETHHRRLMSHDHHPQLCDVTADMENTASSIIVCWTMFTGLLPGNMLFKSITILQCSIQDVLFTLYYFLFPQSITKSDSVLFTWGTGWQTALAW